MPKENILAKRHSMSKKKRAAQTRVAFLEEDVQRIFAPEIFLAAYAER